MTRMVDHFSVNKSEFEGGEFRSRTYFEESDLFGNKELFRNTSIIASNVTDFLSMCSILSLSGLMYEANRGIGGHKSAFLRQIARPLHF
jgi:hypothetical protein